VYQLTLLLAVFQKVISSREKSFPFEHQPGIACVRTKISDQKISKIDLKSVSSNSFECRGMEGAAGPQRPNNLLWQVNMLRWELCLIIDESHNSMIV
jgi:hypothetical protein